MNISIAQYVDNWTHTRLNCIGISQNKEIFCSSGPLMWSIWESVDCLHTKNIFCYNSDTVTACKLKREIDNILVKMKVSLEWELWYLGELLRVGNRTDCALLELVERLDCNIDSIHQDHQVLKQVPFSSERKRMTTIVSPTNRFVHPSFHTWYCNCFIRKICKDSNRYVAEDTLLCKL